eukprot:1156246-Pelagomonas_calceolata.AAC.1
MEQCLQWRHLAPTAPDTLASYPFDAFDPFIIESTPHVLFAGNQPEFGVRSIQVMLFVKWRDAQSLIVVLGREALDGVGGRASARS